MRKEGTLVDATIFEAPPSKECGEEPGPGDAPGEERQRVAFGVKAHIGVDADSGPVQSVVTTAADEPAVSQAHTLLHGHAQEAFGDAGYTGVDKRERMKRKTVKWHVAAPARQDQGDA
ncbi:transposase DDE domain protein [Paraburkholderia xenovorans LB400]|uniref:transposase n=1 Tax=Paraburkholderia xenovorans TaxID=36873 RepID=UPI00003C4F03|nr:transposase [Paraburkholderia xenovorans]AIP34633.1 transposase DDE domain protein [Paraburkholderia xenovorans LB400]